MTDDQIIWEYRQIKAIEHEDKTEKPYNEDAVVVDKEYEDWQKSIGIDRNAMNREGTVL